MVTAFYSKMINQGKKESFGAHPDIPHFKRRGSRVQKRNRRKEAPSLLYGDIAALDSSVSSQITAGNSEQRQVQAARPEYTQVHRKLL